MPQRDYSMPRKPMAAPGTRIEQGSMAVIVVTGPVRGGYIQNPKEQTSSLFIDLVNTPKVHMNGQHTTLELLPGDRFDLPTLQSGVQVKANSELTGHEFTAVIW